MKTTRRPGFTLTELLVVIAITGVLTAVVLPAIQRVRAFADTGDCPQLCATHCSAFFPPGPQYDQCVSSCLPICQSGTNCDAQCNSHCSAFFPPGSPQYNQCMTSCGDLCLADAEICKKKDDCQNTCQLEGSFPLGSCVGKCLTTGPNCLNCRCLKFEIDVMGIPNYECKCRK